MYSTIIAALEAAVSRKPHEAAFVFCENNEEILITYTDLMQKAKAIAGTLAAYTTPGSHVVLLYPFSIDYVTAFFGCLYAGITAVPFYASFENEFIQDLQHVIESTKPALCLSNQAALDKLKKMRFAIRLQQIPIINKIATLLTGPDAEKIHLPIEWDIEKLTCIATDKIALTPTAQYKSVSILPETIALLQYTAGTSGPPKGVMLTHQNLVHTLENNHQEMSLQENDVFLNALSPYYCFGLVMGVLQPIYSRIKAYHIPFSALASNPLLWLQALSKHQATISGGGDFLYQTCSALITAEEKEDLDLSSWQIAFSAGEKVRNNTFSNFYQNFRSNGVRQEIFFPMYGLTEAASFVLGSKRNKGAQLHYVDKEALKLKRVLSKTQNAANAVAVTTYSLMENSLEIRIIDPATREPCSLGNLGEIWIQSPSVAKGYWRQAELSKQTFDNVLDSGSFLRTGDYGYQFDNQILVFGNYHEVITLDNYCYFPEDIEFHVGYCHSNLRPGLVMAFSLQNQLIIIAETGVIEADRAKAVFSTIQRTLQENFGIGAKHIALVDDHTFKIAVMGKIKRSSLRRTYQNRQMPVVHEWTEKGKVTMDLAFLPVQKTGPVSAPVMTQVDEKLQYSPPVNEPSLHPPPIQPAAIEQSNLQEAPAPTTQAALVPPVSVAIKPVFISSALPIEDAGSFARTFIFDSEEGKSASFEPSDTLWTPPSIESSTPQQRDSLMSFILAG